MERSRLTPRAPRVAPAAATRRTCKQVDFLQELCCFLSFTFPSFLGWPSLADSLGSLLSVSRTLKWQGPEICTLLLLYSSPWSSLSRSSLMAAESRTSEMRQIQLRCPCKIAAAESRRTVFRGLRSLSLVYDAWRKGPEQWFAMGRRERRLKPLCVERISLWLNCVLPLANIGAYFSCGLCNESGAVVNNSGPVAPCKNAIAQTGVPTGFYGFGYDYSGRIYNLCSWQPTWVPRWMDAQPTFPCERVPSIYYFQMTLSLSKVTPVGF